MIFMQICRGRDLTFPTQGDKILAWCVTLHSSSDGWGGGSVAAVAMYNTGQRQRNLILHLYCPKWWQFGSDTSHSQPNHCVYKTQQCAPLSPVTRDILHTLQSVTCRGLYPSILCQEEWYLSLLKFSLLLKFPEASLKTRCKRKWQKLVIRSLLLHI